MAGLRVTNCEIAYIGVKNSGSAYGLSVHQSDMYIGHNEFHDCGRRAVSLVVYDNTPNITFENVIVEHNHFYNGYHTTGVDCNNTGAHTVRNITIRNNLIEGNPEENLQAEDGHNSNSIFLANQGSGYIGNFRIYNNIFTYSHGSSIKIESVDSVEIYHNTFFNFNPTLDNYQAHVYTSSYPHAITVINNIFFNNAADTRLTCVKMDEDSRSEFTIDRNLYYHSGAGQRFMWINGGSNYNIDDWETYQSATGLDANSPAPGDPLFTNAPADFLIGDASPAIGAGTALEGISSDYYARALNDPPDLGAVQSGTQPLSFRESLEERQSVAVSAMVTGNVVSVSVTAPDREAYSLAFHALDGTQSYQTGGYAGSQVIRITAQTFESGSYIISRSTGDKREYVGTLTARF